jgi:hypothetical protein
MGVQTPVARLLINSLTPNGFKLFELKVGKIVYSVDKEQVVPNSLSMIHSRWTIYICLKVFMNKSTLYIVDKLLSVARYEGVGLST